MLRRVLSYRHGAAVVKLAADLVWGQVPAATRSRAVGIFSTIFVFLSSLVTYQDAPRPHRSIQRNTFYVQLSI